MLNGFKTLAIVPALAGVAAAGDYSRPVVVTRAVPVAAVPVGSVAVLGLGGCLGCDRPTLADRRAERRASRGSRLGGCGCGGCEVATQAVQVTETPAVLRTEAIYQTRKVGQKTTLVPANQATTQTPAGKSGK
jgi:hypothetical protein